MDSFTVTTTLDRSDWQALLKACIERANERKRQRSFFARAAPGMVWLGVTLGLVALMDARPDFISIPAVVAAAVIFVAATRLLAHLQRSNFAPDENGAFLGTTSFEFSASGFVVSRAHTSTHCDWTQLFDLTRTPTHIFVWIDTLSAYCMRVQDLPPSITAEDVIGRLRAFKLASAESPSVPSTSLPASAGSPDSPDVAPPESTQPMRSTALPTVGQELAAVFRSIVRAPVDPAHLHGRDITIGLLGIANILLWIAAQRFAFESDGSAVLFLWWGAPELGRLVLAALIVASVLSRSSIPALPLRRALLLVLGFMPVLILVWTFLGSLPKFGISVVVALTMLFGAYYLARTLRAMTDMRQTRAVAGAIVTTAGLLWLGASYFLAPTVWYIPDDEESSASELNREQLLFDQPARIDAELAKMSAPAADAAAVYFVGFAGFGNQRVFAEEIGTAASVVGERYQTSKRQLLLINDRRDEETLPYATAPALRYGLAQVAKRMNRERDVLFLALSSHGGEDATLSVSNEAFYWNDLSGGELREMLDASGIQWRVIVISACHSGSFIEHLKDERTIVLTAAAKERTSFGCSDDRDLTYFGEAFYRDALPAAPTLRSAFEAAYAAIDAREKTEKVSRSDPQASFGELMEKKLAEMEGIRLRDAAKK
jgi:hypothetical protein